MHAVPLAWVAAAFIIGGGAGILAMALIAAGKIADANRIAERWRGHALANDEQIDELLSALAQIRGCARAAGRREV